MTSVFRLDGKVALMTGAASGIGAATATLFAEAGADLVLGWYGADPHDVGPVARAIEERGRRAVAVEGNVAETGDVDRMIATAIETFGRLDIVVANAAILRAVDPAEGLRDFERIVPVGRNGRPEDMAAAFLYLASDEASFVTAQSIVVDGGVTAAVSLPG